MAALKAKQMEIEMVQLKGLLKVTPKAPTKAHLMEALMVRLMASLMDLQMARTMVLHSAHQMVSVMDDSKDRLRAWYLAALTVRWRKKDDEMDHWMEQLKVSPKAQ